MNWPSMAAGLSNWWANISWTELFWVSFGILAQMMFGMRFILQIIASERVKKSIVPETFWYFSFAGGVGLLTYAIHKVDPVFILGQALGLGIYSRNIYWIWRHKRGGETSSSLKAAE
jgi:lipid-A-disaccharide synthase-like uncharacterized protein